MDVSDIGPNLNKIRTFRGLSIKEAARRSGVAPSTISLWEHGKRRPRHDQLKKLLDVYVIKYEDLFADFDAMFVAETLKKYEDGESTTAKDVEIILTANPALTPADVETIMHIVNAKDRELREQEEKE